MTRRTGTFTDQLKALVWRNILLKTRNKKQTVQEFLLPIGFILLLALIKWLSTPKQEPAIPDYPAHNLFTSKFSKTGLLYVYDYNNSTEVRNIVDLVCKDGDYEPMYFSSLSEMDQTYEDMENKTDVVAGLIFNVNTTDLMFNYSIRVRNSHIPDEKPFEFVKRGSCRDPTGLSQDNDCQANKYLWTGFAALQATVDAAIIRLYGNQPNFVRPRLNVKLFPKDVYTPDTTFIRYLSSIYVVLAFMPFVGVLMAMIVTEKEKRIKETMKMMGMKDSAFWCAWGIVYTVMAVIIAAVITLLGWAAQLLVRSNFFVLFLLVFLYCTSIIAMGFMMSTFFSNAKVASAAGALAPMMVSMIYFGVAATRSYQGGLPTSAIPPGGQWILCLFSPLALALGVDWALFLDITFEDGANFGHNMYIGEFPLYAPVLMLAFDTVLYALLTAWFDSIVPNEFGSAKCACFCLMPSFWRHKEKTDEELEQLMLNSQPTNEDNPRNSNIENIPTSESNKAALRIHNIKKKFKVDGEEGPVMKYAVNGISLDIYEGQITALLGHNGAGKTTLINMLTGQMPPTSGNATTYGLDVSDSNDMTHIREFTGVCPQINVMFEDLSAVENLYVFGILAGVPKSSIHQQIERSLAEVDLVEQKNKRACNLSGGQKRKLQLAMALIGNPKVIFLDEPTAGMDPASRRHVWSVLKKRRAGRVIVLTTHFMDEADILADRKAVICNGQLRCVGSSLFLKNKFGIGYYLNMVATSNCDMRAVDDLVFRHVPTAQQGRSHGMELTYTLPHDEVDKFAGLFSELEEDAGGETRAQSLGISSYGVSMTTLEEVFLKLENTSGNLEEAARPILRNGWRKKPTKQSDLDMAVENNHVNSVENHNYHTSIDMMRPSSADSSRTFPMIQDNKWKLAKQRFLALVKIKLLIQLRNPAAVFFRLGFPIILMLLGVCFYQFVFIEVSSKGWETPKLNHIKPDVYAHVPARKTVPAILFKSVVDFGSEPPYYMGDYPSFEFGLYTQGFNRTQDFNSSSNLLQFSPLHMGYIIHNYEVNVDNQLSSTNFTVLYNDTAIHSLPAGLNVLSNSILRASAPWVNVTNTSTFSALMNRINVSSYPWPDVGTEYGFSYGSFFIVMLAGMALSIIPPGFGTDLVTDREIKARGQLRTAGMSHDMYMGATVFADSCQIYGVMFVFVIILLAFRVEGFYHPGAMICLVLLFLFYGFLNMLTVYNLSFFFDNTESALNVLPTLTFLVALIPYMAVGLLDSYEGTAKTVAFSLHILLTLANPLYASYGGLNYILKVYRSHVALYGPTEYLPISAYFKWEAGIVIVLIAPPVHCIWNYFLLRYLEVRSGGGDIRDAFQVCGCKPKDDDIDCLNEDVPDNEDIDVTMERERIQELDNEANAAEPVVKVLKLRKEFKPPREDRKNQEKYQTLQTENGMMVAVKNVSFAVMPGEVFGLLGPNGAGKTTTLNMIIAEKAPTKGKVTAGGHCVHSSMSEAFKVMGYCPQHDALWDRITPKEHIECYAAIRGIPSEEVPLVAEYFIESLHIQEHRNKRSKNLSGGTKRKLSYAMSMLGDPRIVLLDEPSTGMDPKSKRFLWDTITSSFEGSKRGAILTTHYMEEADALCSRISIMVNGRMECIGSTQHLKDKYGGGYILEVKARSNEDVQEPLEYTMARLHEFVLQLFPGAERVEYFSDWMTYKIPQRHVKSLAAIFEAFESGKHKFNIEEYSFSQSTLEQVFLQFAKLQTEDLEEEENAALKRQTSLLAGSTSDMTTQL